MPLSQACAENSSLTIQSRVARWCTYFRTKNPIFRIILKTFELNMLVYFMTILCIYGYLAYMYIVYFMAICYTLFP
jgi:hypothetical protein